jgi:translation elongation factor EF-4
MKMNSKTLHFLILHFNKLTGPEIIFSLPEDIPESIGNRLRGIFDLNLDDQFLEITIKKENIKITNMYFEIASDWGRGNVEMVMLSVITDENYDNGIFQNVLLDFSNKLKNIKDIYQAFYYNIDDYSRLDEIKRKRAELKELVIECFENLKSKSTADIEEEKIIKKFKKLSW